MFSFSLLSFMYSLLCLCIHSAVFTKNDAVFYVGGPGKTEIDDEAQLLGNG